MLWAKKVIFADFWQTQPLPGPDHHLILESEVQLKTADRQAHNATAGTLF